jgi:cytochrome c biogenesis protein CcdA
MIKKCLMLFDIERKRYRRKGITNSILGFVLLFVIMESALRIGDYYWPDIIEDKIQFVIIGSIVINLVMEIVGFLVYLPGYLGWSKYYDSHLINKKSSRPWERKNWP